MPTNDLIIVQPIESEMTEVPTWLPVEGRQTRAILTRTFPDKPEAQKSVLRSSTEILGRCIRPDQGAGKSTGLVVGYVQSGKTLSFTTVIAMARDNGFPIVIVIAGTKNPLLSQSEGRLNEDLRMDSDDGGAAWRPIPSPGEEHKDTVKHALSEWRDPEADDDERPTVVMTVLKQTKRLNNLVDLFVSLKDDLKGVPALIIDDEADQASLNAAIRQDEETATYSWICALRDALPLHGYLQYTATPQAPLLINMASMLSPDFVYVLEPGDGYVGGREFFADRSPYIVPIPARDIFKDDEIPHDPPDSLLAAMRVFFVGLASAMLRRSDAAVQRRSMLMHPSMFTQTHLHFARWATSARTRWLANLELPDGDTDKADTLLEFADAYADLKRTDPSFPDFEQISTKLRRSLRNTQVIEFNARGKAITPKIRWRDAKGWILVGGNAVDRGFTVTDLTVTYMPRGLGVGNADTLQQRARFFGYKRKFLGQCRIYLPQGAVEAFSGYVKHEEAMRIELEKLSSLGKPLKGWVRRFILPAELKPCRASVIALGDEYVRSTKRSEWTQQKDAVITPEIRQQNCDLMTELEVELEDQFAWDETFPTERSGQRHMVANHVPLSRVLDFLVKYQLTHPLDVQQITGLLVQLDYLVRDNGDATAAVYRMRPSFDDGKGRTVDEDGLFPTNFLQGQTGKGLADGQYPGDKFYHADGRVTLHLHRLKIKKKGEPVIDHAAPMIAVCLPKNLVLGWLVQQQEEGAP